MSFKDSDITAVASRGEVRTLVLAMKLAELGYAPVNQYLPPRPSQAHAGCTGAEPLPNEDVAPATGFLRWVDRLLSR